MDNTSMNSQNSQDDLKKLQILINNLDFPTLEPTIIDIINGDYYDEELISKYLTFLLNPKKCYFAEEVLRKLINFNAEIELGSFQSIQREAYADGGRIDILVKYTNTWVVIENKIRSYENYIIDKFGYKVFQTECYYKYIQTQLKKSMVQNVIYAYLKPSWNNSEPRCEKFMIRSYIDFLSRLKGIEKQTNYKENIFFYLEEFIRIGERFEKMGEIIIDDKINFYVENLLEIKQLENYYQENNEKILNKLTMKLKEKFEVHGYEISSHMNYIQIFKSKWNQYNIHFEILSDELPKLLNRSVSLMIALHIECQEENYVRRNLGNNNIYRGKGNVAVENDNRKIEEKLDLSFKNLNEIDDSVEIITNSVLKLKEKYERIIDSAIG